MRKGLLTGFYAIAIYMNRNKIVAILRIASYICVGHVRISVYVCVRGGVGVVEDVRVSLSNALGHESMGGRGCQGVSFKCTGPLGNGW